MLLIRQYLPKYRWQPALTYKSEQPYGLNQLYTILEKSYPENKFVLVNQPINSIIGDDKTKSLLFYAGYDTYYDSLTVQWFKEYMYRGNKICIASTNLPYQLLSEIFEIDGEYFYANSYSDSMITTHFLSDTSKIFQFHFQLLKKKGATEWHYFADTTMKVYWRNYLYEPLSELDSGRTNFIRVDYGRGSLYVYTTPLLLTNYYISTPRGFEYANHFFETMGTVETFYWDNFSRFPGFGNSTDADNLLEFILSKKELRMAWYLLLLAIVLFALFKLKRRQKPIPVILPDKNSSIEFAKAVGLLHFKTSSTTDLSAQLMKLFFAFVKDRYKVNLNKDREIQKKQIVLLSGINKKIIDDIYKEHFSIKYNPEPDRSQSIKLHSLLEYFYQNCK